MSMNLKGEKFYCFRVGMRGFALNYCVAAIRLDLAIRALYDLYLDLGECDEPMFVSSRYTTYRVVDGVKVNERQYSLKNELKSCVRIVSQAFYDSFYTTKKVSLVEFIESVKSVLDDEPETRLENIGMTNTWSRR